MNKTSFADYKPEGHNWITLAGGEFYPDGPGLLLGSMWDDYAALESRWPGKIMVVTLRMTTDRLTTTWLRA